MRRRRARTLTLLPSASLSAERVCRGGAERWGWWSLGRVGLQGDRVDVRINVRPPANRLVQLGFGKDPFYDIEVFGILESLQEDSALLRAGEIENGRANVPHVCIYREAEQQKL